MRDLVVDIHWINVEHLQQRGRKRRRKQLCMHPGKCLLLNTTGGVISRLVSQSGRRKNLCWTTMTTWRQTSWYRQLFYVTSAKHYKASWGWFFLFGSLVLTVEVSYTTFALSFLVLQNNTTLLFCSIFGQEAHCFGEAHVTVINNLGVQYASNFGGGGCLQHIGRDYAKIHVTVSSLLSPTV